VCDSKTIEAASERHSTTDFCQLFLTHTYGPLLLFFLRALRASVLGVGLASVRQADQV